MELAARLKNRTTVLGLVVLACAVLVGMTVGGTYALWHDDTAITVSKINAGDLDVKVVKDGLHFELGDYRLPADQRVAATCESGHSPTLDKNAKQVTFGSWDKVVTGVLPVKIRSWGDNIAGKISVAGDAKITGDQESMQVSDFKLFDAEGKEVSHVANTGEAYKDYFVKFVVTPKVKPSVSLKPSQLQISHISVKVEQETK